MNYYELWLWSDFIFKMAEQNMISQYIISFWVFMFVLPHRMYLKNEAHTYSLNKTMGPDKIA